MTASTRTLTPGNTTPGVGAYAETPLPGLEPARTGPASAGEDSWPWAITKPRTTPPAPPPEPRLPEVPGMSPVLVGQVLDRTTDPDFHDWMHHIKGAAACRHPIRLEGAIHVQRDGQRIASYWTDDMPDGAIYTPCGNRRASVCPACAAVYRQDTFHLIRAGLQGDRWGIPPLDEHIALFVTATAPSFGKVHHRVVDKHAADCKKKDGCTCRPKICHAFGKPCRHGQPMTCRERHGTKDARLGQPLCLDCYDHDGHVIWNHEAPELWRRTSQEIRREIERLGRRLGVELRRRYLKVYEFQVRGIIHYHIFIRLDGYNPDCPQAIVPPDQHVPRQALEAAVRHAFGKVTYTCAPHPANQERGWLIRWGEQLDVAHINAPGGPVNRNQLAGYSAKYVTKDTEVTGLDLRRVDDYILEHLDMLTHTGRLIRACWDLGEHEPYRRLRRYAHRYGYGGHITTKSRQFTVTMAFVREQRTIWRRTDGHPQLWDEQIAELIVAELGYQATGWRTPGDALLARTSADLARQYAETSRLEAGNPTPQLVAPVAA